MLPRPTAEPAAASTKPILPVKELLLVVDCSIIFPFSIFFILN